MDLPDIAEEGPVQALIGLAFLEDVGGGDATTLSLVPDGAEIGAKIVAREACIVSGCEIAAAVFRRLDEEIDVRLEVPDGERAAPGDRVLGLRGRARAILSGERIALNFMQRMSGIATVTRQFVDAVAEHGTMILDTRKTTPGLRLIEKYAVLCGGGTNHRMGLHDRAMIKDNHRNLWRKGGADRLDEAVAACREVFPDIPVEVEVESEAELLSALAGDPEWILLDNMPPEDMRRCVEITAGRAQLEASGGITLETVKAAAASGVDAISLGCLTHSAPSVDLSLEIDEA